MHSIIIYNVRKYHTTCIHVYCTHVHCKIYDDLYSTVQCNADTCTSQYTVYVHVLYTHITQYDC